MAPGRRAVPPRQKGDEAFPRAVRQPGDEAPAADTLSAVQAGVITHGGGAALQRLAGNRAARSVIQAKLTVGPSGDQHEQEADRVAGEVMRNLQRQPMEEEEEMLQASRLQRQPMEEEEEMLQASRLQRQPMEEEEEMLQAKAVEPVVGMEGGDVDAATGLEIRQAKGRGKPLDSGLRRSMEKGFGVDFASVRVHDDDAAHRVNQKLQAKAFTSGSDIFFRKGRYNPSSRSGQELVAHELTHVVQQGAAGVPSRSAGKSNIGGAISRVFSGARQLASVARGSIQRWPSKLSRHFRERAAERGITEANADAAVANGTKYSDPDYPGATVHFDPASGTVVAEAANGTKTTCYKRTRPKPRWVRK